MSDKSVVMFGRNAPRKPNLLEQILEAPARALDSIEGFFNRRRERKDAMDLVRAFYRTDGESIERVKSSTPCAKSA